MDLEHSFPILLRFLQLTVRRRKSFKLFTVIYRGGLGINMKMVIKDVHQVLKKTKKHFKINSKLKVKNFMYYLS